MLAECLSSLSLFTSMWINPYSSVGGVSVVAEGMKAIANTILSSGVSKAAAVIVPAGAAIGALTVSHKVINRDPSWLPLIAKCSLALFMWAGLKYAITTAMSDAYVASVTNFLKSARQYIFTIGGVVLVFYSGLKAGMKANQGDRDFIVEIALGAAAFVILAAVWIPSGSSSNDVIVTAAGAWKASVKQWVLALSTIIGAVMALYGTGRLAAGLYSGKHSTQEFVFLLFGYIMLASCVAFIKKGQGEWSYNAYNFSNSINNIMLYG